MKNLILLATVVLVGAVSFGCSKDDSSPTDNNVVLEIDGIWVSSRDDNHTLTIENGMMKSYAIHTDVIDTLTEPNFTTVTATTIEERILTLSIIGEKVIQPNDMIVTKMDAVMVGYYFTPLTTSRAAEWNAEMMCGYQDWKIDERKDCIHKRENKLYKDIYYLDGDTLTFGDNDQLDADGYPDALDYSYVWIRQ